MRTVNEVSKLTGVSVRTLQYYDAIGLLKPREYTKSGYRLYDDIALERLQQILLFKELEFPLKTIKEIMDSPDFNRDKALEQQIELLLLKREHIENLIAFARRIKRIGVNEVDFQVFNKSKLEEYSKRAKEEWGATAAYQEWEEKNNGITFGKQKENIHRLMLIFTKFGEMKEQSPSSQDVQTQVERLQKFITEHYYTCTKEILASLSKMYASGGEFTKNIDQYGGEGTAVFVARAIDIYCQK